MKEAVCRQIIKIFGEKRKGGIKGHTAGGPTPGRDGATAGGPKEDENYKIEFISLVEALLKTMKNSNFNLTSLAASALVNLCNYSDDIKEIFI